MSHELRTPLNAILGFGQLLQQDVASGAAATGPQAAARGADYAQHVLVAGRHMLELVDDLLELQRLDTQAEDLPLELLDLADVVAESLVLLMPAAQAAGLDLVTLVPPAIQVRSHGRSLRQMLLNLGSNAIKYGRREGSGSRVVVSAHPEEAAIELHVADRGPGLTATQLAQLFTPFERLGQAGGAHGGSGLGLVITRQMAQRLGATVWLRSERGRGTTAILRLPR